jgi:hypothetical protein
MKTRVQCHLSLWRRDADELCRCWSATLQLRLRVYMGGRIEIARYKEVNLVERREVLNRRRSAPNNQSRINPQAIAPE